MDEEKWEFKVEKECKGSRRYAAVHEDCPIKTLYVDRDFAEGKNTISIILSGE